ncbi:anti-sigma factor [Tepidibacter formicigenes]|jgi:hypothetical protein|uniref:DUF4367 domain-containing protein n=1 Tax=Tepidibacter formicigenes DSM 15518 TaxID=1123349 RepID=A0A1M6N9Q9_9FIRM|nr:hypothetical protein [Tepidibacter formicigenes]SHJ92458.1 hypothetical protein SAMN02744037_01200 [Tepidibacter formicigenes DSM 15518]
MCYDIEILQKIIDNAYEGDINEVLSHIKTCPSCKNAFEKLKHEDNFIENVLNEGIKIPPRRPINIYTVDFKEKQNNKRRIFNMSKKARRWSAIAAGIVICGGLLFAEPVRAKAEELLKMFRMQEITTVSISESDISEIDKLFREGNGYKDIPNIGSIDVSSQGKEIRIENPKGADEIKEKMNIDRIVKVPKGFVYDYASKEPKADVTIKLDIDKTNDLLKYLGEEISLPKLLDKKPFIIHFNDIVSYEIVKETKNEDEIRKYINVTQMDAPTVEIPKDVDEKKLIKTLFSMKFLPENLKKQFMSIDNLTSTLPVPYSTEYQTKEDITVNGQNAILIKDKDSKYPYLSIYFKDKDKVYVVNSNCSVEEILPLIEEMK